MQELAHAVLAKRLPQLGTQQLCQLRSLEVSPQETDGEFLAELFGSAWVAHGPEQIAVDRSVVAQQELPPGSRRGISLVLMRLKHLGPHRRDPGEVDVQVIGLHALLSSNRRPRPLKIAACGQGLTRDSTIERDWNSFYCQTGGITGPVLSRSPWRPYGR